MILEFPNIDSLEKSLKSKNTRASTFHLESIVFFPFLYYVKVMSSIFMINGITFIKQFLLKIKKYQKKKYYKNKILKYYNKKKI